MLCPGREHTFSFWLSLTHRGQVISKFCLYIYAAICKVGGNRGKFIGSNLGMFCYEEFEKVALRNLLANRKPHLLFILRQSEANM